MTLLQLKKHFFSQLSKVYDEEERTVFFQILAEYKLGLHRAELALYPDIVIEKENLYFFQNAIERLTKNEPIQYITGEAFCYNSLFKVNKNVLIPRPETEELIDWIIHENKGKAHLKILDIGTGSGCIAINLAKNLPHSEVWGLDISAEALKIARENAQQNGVALHFLQADINNFKTPEIAFDLIVSNPPYVRISEKKNIQKNVLNFEPEIALFVPDDAALILYEKIAAFALTIQHSKPIVYLEINQYLGKETQQLFLDKGFDSVLLKKDFLGNNRFIKAV